MAGNRLSFGASQLLLVITCAALTCGSPCTLVKDQWEYDLSSLAARNYWRVQETIHADGSDVEIYLSLCHPLKDAPNGCAGNDTGVCITQVSREGGIRGSTRVTVPNAGRVSPVGPTIPRGQLMVEYVMEGGDACPHSEGETYRTSMNFICAHTPEDETGPVLMSSTRCQLLFAWMTQAACPRRLDVVSNTSCSIQFPSSGHKLHLQTLRAETHFLVTSAAPPGTYEVNICGPVVNGSCGGEDVAVCYVPQGGNPRVLTTTRDMKVRWEEDTLALTYRPSDQGQGVEVKFSCERSATKTRVNYVTQNHTTVILAVRTSAVCLPTPTPHCVLEDHAGNVYDLRPLHRAQDNWEVLQSVSDGQEALYYLNICGPVNPAKPYTCPLGLIGACMAGIGAEAGYNLGLLTSDPTINTEDGSITILYSGGEPCKEGQHSHSTRINLICDVKEHGPVLVKETNTCEYVFDWLTPVACPRHFTTGSNCKVEDPHYGNVYDLNPLRNIHKDYSVTSDGKEFLINLCGPLVSPCEGENGTSGACQVIKDQQLNAGLYTTQVTFNDGTLMMKYVNGTSRCQGNTTISSQIIFLCDHEVSGRDGPIFIHHDGCSNSFFWKTKQACPPFRVVDCTLYTADGRMYDLQELSSSDTNLEYYTSSEKFVLNVCRSVVHQKGSRCAYRAGACIIDRTHHNNSINIGEVQSGPYLEDGKLMLKYAGGDECEGHQQLYQTRIKFVCDKNETLSLPYFIAEENCTYYFELRSAAACPVSLDDTSFPQVGRDCNVTSPTGYTFDLSSLKQETGYKVKNDKNLTMTLNVCAALKNQECSGEDVGACINTVNAGHANANLYYLPELLSLHYTEGEQCNKGVNRSTMINFVCGAENVTEGPVLVFDDTEQCVYFITWQNELACEKRIPCFVETWTHRIDLSPLIKSSGNYEAINPKNLTEKFYLNVCRPLNPIIGLNCRPGSAVCISSSIKGKSPLSLGHPNVTPVYDSGGARIMYTHGATCPTVPDYNFSSVIHFICDPSAGKGSPVFKEMTHDCQYQFEWHTSVVCNSLPKVEDSGLQCHIRFDDAKANIDLKPLHRPEGYQVNFGNKTFTVNICGSACNNTSGSCTSDGDSYGLSKKSELQWNYGQLSLTYYGGSHCNESLSGHKTTTIHFECDMNVGFGFPVADELMESLDCHAIFMWKTNVTCIEGIYATEDTPPLNISSANNTAGQNDPSKDSLKIKTSTHATATTVIATVLVVSGVILVVALVLIKSRRGNHIIAATRRLFGIHSPTTLLLDDIS